MYLENKLLIHGDIFLVNNCNLYKFVKYEK